MWQGETFNLHLTYQIDLKGPTEETFSAPSLTVLGGSKVPGVG